MYASINQFKLTTTAIETNKANLGALPKNTRGRGWHETASVNKKNKDNIVVVQKVSVGPTSKFRNTVITNKNQEDRFFSSKKKIDFSNQVG